MGRRPRPFKIGPPTRGLTDFPERATPEHSTQALNVNFSSGGVATRRGTEMIANDFYTNGGAQSATVKLVKSFRLGTNFAPATVVGLVPTSGGDANSERVLIRTIDELADGGRPFGDFEVTAADNRTVASPASRWDACAFNGTLIVCTDHEIPNQSNVHYWEIGFDFVFDLSADGPNVNGGVINRSATPYHGGAKPDSPYSDDPGDYTLAVGSGMRAKYCRSHRGRLVLGNITNEKLPFVGGVGPSGIWYSNLLDHRGWPIENFHVPTGGDQGPVTGLGIRGDHVVVFREGSISLFRVDGPFRTVYRQVVSDRGCIAHGTIVEDVMGMTCFLSNDGFYGFDGTNMHHLSEPIERTIRQSINSVGSIGGAHAVHYPKEQQVWLALPEQSKDAPDTVYVMDYGNGYKGKPAWSVYHFQNSTWSASGFRNRQVGYCTSPGGARLYGVHTDSNNRPGYELFDVGDASDQQQGTPFGFQSRWESGPVGYGNNEMFRWRFIRPMVRPTMDDDITCWWRTDEQGFDADGSLNGQSNDFAPDDDSGGAALGAFVLGTSRLGVAEDHNKRVDVNTGGVCRYGRVGFQTTGSPIAVGEKFDIRGVEIDVIRKGNVRR